MYSRWTRILLVMFCAVWFGAVVPGHRRGIVRLAAAPSIEAPNLPPCHRAKAAKTSSPADKPSEPARPSGCAICMFAAALTPPAPPVLMPAPESAGLIADATVPASPACIVFLPYHGRAPPHA